MDWIRTQYDRLIVMAAIAFLFISSVAIWRNATEFVPGTSAQQWAPPPKKPKPPGRATELDAALDELSQPPQWTFSGRSGLFVPERHFIAANGFPATLESTQVHPPVPNEWLEEFGLPIADSDVLSQDPDGDGFTNLDEWEGHSNPIDRNSHPPYVNKLKLKAFSEEPFRLMFSSWDGDTFGINAIDLKEPTQFLKVGDTIKGTRFKIVKFTEKHQPNPATGGEKDVSELHLENEDTHEKLTLVKEEVAISPESVATFVYSWPAGQAPREFQVRKDQEFSLKPEEEIKYKLVDVEPNKAVIVDTRKPDQPIQIGKVTP
jgi:hypothetical protein